MSLLDSEAWLPSGIRLATSSLEEALSKEFFAVLEKPEDVENTADISATEDMEEPVLDLLTSVVLTEGGVPLENFDINVAKSID